MCGVGYYWDPVNMVCLSCGLGCGVCRNAYSCFTCGSGYYMDYTSRCISCGYSCLTCPDNTKCTSCQAGYYKDPRSNKCSACSPLCATCSQFGDNNCQSCFSFAQFISNTSGVGACICKPGFVFDSTKEFCVRVVTAPYSAAIIQIIGILTLIAIILALI